MGDAAAGSVPSDHPLARNSSMPLLTDDGHGAGRSSRCLLPTEGHGISAAPPCHPWVEAAAVVAAPSTPTPAPDDVSAAASAGEGRGGASSTAPWASRTWGPPPEAARPAAALSGVGCCRPDPLASRRGAGPGQTFLTNSRPQASLYRLKELLQVRAGAACCPATAEGCATAGTIGGACCTPFLLPSPANSKLLQLKGCQHRRRRCWRSPSFLAV